MDRGAGYIGAVGLQADARRREMLLRNNLPAVERMEAQLRSAGHLLMQLSSLFDSEFSAGLAEKTGLAGAAYSAVLAGSDEEDIPSGFIAEIGQLIDEGAQHGAEACAALASLAAQLTSAADTIRDTVTPHAAQTADIHRETAYAAHELLKWDGTYRARNGLQSQVVNI